MSIFSIQLHVSFLASQITTNIFWIPGILLQLMSFRSIAGPIALRSSHRFGILQGSLACYVCLFRTVDIPRSRNSESKGWIVWMAMDGNGTLRMIPCLCMAYMHVWRKSGGCLEMFHKSSWLRVYKSYSVTNSQSIPWSPKSNVVFCYGFSGTSPCRPDSLVDSTKAMRAMGDPTPTSRLDIATGHMAPRPAQAAGGCSEGSNSESTCALVTSSLSVYVNIGK